MLGKAVLLTVMPFAVNRIDKWIIPLNDAMSHYEINTQLRCAAFIAQIAHESGELRYVREIASGAAYDTGALARRLGNTPEADGDGQRYKGRGLIQVTGTDNYRACGEALNLPLLEFPEMLELPIYAAASAAWFWKSRGLNELADTKSFKEITKKINGGYNGFTERKAYYEKAQAVI